MIPGPEGDRFNLFATIGPRDRPGYILSGHMDVVSVEGQAWGTDPFRLASDGARLWGGHDRHERLSCLRARHGSGVPRHAADASGAYRLLL